MKRRFNPAELELMDRPQPVSAELERDLENIRQLNRWFGSYALISIFLSGWIKPGARLRIVDLATGSGDIPRLIAEYGRKVGGELRIEALDRQAATLEIAKKLRVHYAEITFIDTDGLSWQHSTISDVEPSGGISRYSIRLTHDEGCDDNRRSAESREERTACPGSDYGGVA